MKGKPLLPALSLILTFAVFAVLGCSRDNDVQAAPEDRRSGLPAEQDFLMKVSAANVDGIRLARQALHTSQDDDVKDFARMIERHHTETLGELTELMKDNHLAPSREPSPESAQEMDRLRRLSGGEFDREYVNLMVEKGQASIELFRDQVSPALNREVKDYAVVALPTLKIHLQKAQSLQSKLFSGNAP